MAVQAIEILPSDGENHYAGKESSPAGTSEMSRDIKSPDDVNTAPRAECLTVSRYLLDLIPFRGIKF